jgi:hypothetical protein
MSKESPMRFSRVTEVKSRFDLTGNERFMLTLDCGHTQERMKRRRNRRFGVRPPTKLKCRECEKEAA